MYINYGDKNFFERGVLVDSEHRDSEFQILYCNPYPDEEDLYQFGDCSVNVADTFIDKKQVMDFIGMTEETYDPIHFAIGCIDYYGPENFGAQSYAYDWTKMTKKDIQDILKNRMIANDHLDIDW